jgi:hypothetical protein
MRVTPTLCKVLMLYATHKRWVVIRTRGVARSYFSTFTHGLTLLLLGSISFPNSLLSCLKLCFIITKIVRCFTSVVRVLIFTRTLHTSPGCYIFYNFGYPFG